MNIERTLSIIKPDAVNNDLIGSIYRRFERNGLRIIAAKMMVVTEEQARAFYAVHEGKSFYEPLVKFMMSGPIMVQVLEGENAISRHRLLMGATNPDEAAPGTIRAEFAEATNRNAVHGSDGPDTADVEINFFFKPEEISSRAE